VKPALWRFLLMEAAVNTAAAAGAVAIWKQDWGGYRFTAETFSLLGLFPALVCAGLPEKTARKATAVLAAVLAPIAFFTSRHLAIAMAGV
jgi:hypothetical protein